MNLTEPLSDFVGSEVVLDVTSPYVYIGRLAGEDTHYFILEEADAHDLRDSSSTRELYILDSRRHGIGANRRRVCVMKSQVVSISRLEDVME